MAFENVEDENLIDYSGDLQKSDENDIRNNLRKDLFRLTYNVENCPEDKYGFLKRMLLIVQSLFLDIRGRGIEGIGEESYSHVFRAPSGIRWCCTELPENKGDNEQICLRQIFSSINIKIDDIPSEPHSSLKVVPTAALFLDKNRGSNNRCSVERFIVDPCGEYITGRGKYNPQIIIDLKKIESNHPTEIKNIFIIVLVHELMHAVMDPYNYIHFQRKKELHINYDNLYGIHKEEALANALAYNYLLRKGNESLCRSAKRFMSNQPGPYRYGFEILSKTSPCAIDWILEKVKGSSEIKQLEWLNREHHFLSQNTPAHRVPNPSGISQFLRYSDLPKLKRDTSILNIQPPSVITIRASGHVSFGNKDFVKLSPREYALYAYLAKHKEGLDIASIPTDAKEEISSNISSAAQWDGSKEPDDFFGKIKKDVYIGQLVNSINSKIEKHMSDNGSYIQTVYILIDNEGKRYFIPYISEEDGKCQKESYPNITGVSIM